jgi:hypothetical protein
MGDPACFLHEICSACGRVLEPAQHVAGVCVCGELIDENE